MATNTTTSNTDYCTSDVVTHKMANKKDGFFMLLNYTLGDGTSVKITPTFIFPTASATDEFQLCYVDGTTLTKQEYTLSATGKFFVAVPVPKGCKTVKITAAYTGGTTQALRIDCIDQ